MYPAPPIVKATHTRHFMNKSLRALPWSVAAFTIILLLAAIPFTRLNSEGWIGAPYAIAIVAYAVMGAFVATHHPTNPIGWLQLWSALAFAVAALTSEYSRYGLTRSPSLPWAQYLAWPESFLVILAITPALSIIPLIFPTGSVISRNWGWVLRFVIANMAFFACFSSMRPGLIPSDSEKKVLNPFGVTAIARWVDEIDSILTLLFIGSVLAGAVCLAVRFRAGTEETRQQVKWVAAAVTGWVVVVLMTYPAGWVDPAVQFAIELLLALMFAAIPISVGIAILRWRLYDIDLIVNRTLVYGALTVGVTMLSFVIVGMLGSQVGTRGDMAATILTTGIIAVAFQPLRFRVQRAVDRIMYGERAQPYRVLSRLGRQLEEVARSDDVLTEIVQSIRSALKLPYAAIAIQGRDDLIVVAESGYLAAEPTATLPLTFQGEQVGRLLLDHRSGETGLSTIDRDLLQDLARQIAPTLHGIRLMEDLQRSREQLVTAREEERRRLRHDLHDGLGPALASLSLQLAVVRSRVVVHDPESAVQIGVIKGQLHDAVSDIRRLVYGLRPPALDELGLRGAIREHADRLSGGILRVNVVVVENLPPLPAAVEVAAYRIVLEALTNVARHSAAKLATVEMKVLESPNRALMVKVSDDGRGFSVGATAGAGTISMRERVAELGGRLEIGETPGGGVHVFATFPLLSEAVTRMASSA